MRYLSVCSGIEAATVAWHPLGWEPAAFSEIEAFPRTLLRYHYPDVPLHGRDRRKREKFEDYASEAGFQTIRGDEYGPVDLLVGGTPCQSFSIAGLRGGMADGRGNLALEYIRLAYRLRASWVVWENVPGVFSSNEGEDFRCFLSGLVRWSVPIPEGGWQNSGVIAPGPADGSYGVAWRVLDAQFFGVPQRRRRVFVVGSIGNWQRAAAVLFERHSLSGAAAPRRKTGEEVAGTFTSRARSGGFDTDVDLAAGNYMQAVETFDRQSSGEYGTSPVASTVSARDYKGPSDLVATAFAAEPGMKQTTYIAFTAKDYGGDAIENLSPTLRAGGHADSHANAGVMPAVAFQQSESGIRESDTHATLDANNGMRRMTGVVQGYAVRKLTPMECERLQGFPDSYTLIPVGKDAHQIAKEYRSWLYQTSGRITTAAADEMRAMLKSKFSADGPRYKALGNSMAVPVMAWIGQRIQAVEAIAAERLAA